MDSQWTYMIQDIYESESQFINFNVGWMHVSPNEAIPFLRVRIPKKLSRNLLGEHRLVQTFGNISWWKFMVIYSFSIEDDIGLMKEYLSQSFSHLYHDRRKGHLWQIKWKQITGIIIYILLLSFLSSWIYVLIFLSYFKLRLYVTSSSYCQFVAFHVSIF